MTRFTADIAPDIAAISQLTQQAADFLRGEGVDARAVHHVSLVVEEILINVVGHGGRPDAPVTLLLEVQPDSVLGEIGDCGGPFDPRTAAKPDIGASAEDRPAGGLGLHLVQQLTAALDYRRDGQQNRTTFSILRGESR